MNFATIESRLNAAVLTHLANCTATLDGVAVSGIFDNGSANAFNMMQGSNPTFTCATADSTAAVGKTLIVGGVNYTVREAKPDGTGLSLLELEQA